jgi:hypothetical protein
VIDKILYMPGPDFLVFYIFLFLACWVGAVIWRSSSDNDLGPAIAFIIFELVGGAKLISALSRGKSNVGILVIMMVIGGVVLFVKSMGGTGTGEGSSSCSSCSGSSCGGGGCGGGGCGGCGG